MFSFIAGCFFVIAQHDNYRMISNERHEILSSHIPDSNDGMLQKIRNDNRLIIYTEKEMPKAYQDWDGSLFGIHSPSYNISAAKPQEKFGNANVEFPWGKPAGTELVSDDKMSTFKFILLPKNESIKVSRKFLAGDRRAAYVWEFPQGSIIGEVLQHYYKDKYYTFEVRIRTKDGKEWKSVAYRPFATLKEFAKFCKENNHQLYYYDKKITQSHQIFNGNVISTSLEEVPEEIVIKSLKKEFVNVLGQEWHNDSHAPTTNSDFHIIPKNYQAATIAVSSNSCMRCHESTLKHASDFEPFRDWYGRVRGSDGIFSFHPFDPSCISYNGIYQGEKIRQDFINNKIIKYEN